MKEVVKFVAALALIISLLITVTPPILWVGSWWVDVWFRESGDARNTPCFGQVDCYK